MFNIFIYLSMKAKHGYRNVTGIDYSAASVELARNILQAEDLTDITVKVSLSSGCDIHIGLRQAEYSACVCMKVRKWDVGIFAYILLSRFTSV